MNFVNGALPKIFGEGLLGQCATGLIRIPALLTSLTAAAIVGELAIRGLSNTMQAIGFKPKKDNWISKVSLHFGQVRPYGETESTNILEARVDLYKYSTFSLAKKALCLAAIGIVANEFVRIVGGSTPIIYNHVLAFMGPVRINSESYFANVRETISNLSGTKFF